MYLIIDKVMEFKEVHIANGNAVVEFFTCTTVVKNSFSVCIKTGFLKHINDIAFMSAIEYRSHYLVSESLCRHTEMYLKNLTDIHSGRNAQRIKNDIERTTVR